MSDGNEVYYRILLTSQSQLAVVTMQWFDEYDYDEKKFLKDESGDKMRWENEAEALKYLNDTFKQECIDPDCLTPNHPDFRKMEREHGRR